MSLYDAQSGLDLATRIVRGLSEKYETTRIQRVLDCFDNFNKKMDLDRYLGDVQSDHNRQVARCWVEGIEPISFHQFENNQKLEWVEKLEQNSHIVISEFNKFQGKIDEEMWLIARNEDAGNSYGPQWKTIGLQDRGAWDEQNVSLFPDTVQLLRDLKVPSCEILFARQDGDSGILPHSDLNNFILTCHMGVQVNEGQAWIRVGDDVKYWAVGKALVFDTSIYHSTRNNAVQPRYVLMIRFWHPDLSEEEKGAFEYMFDFLNYSAMGEEYLANFEMRERLKSGIKPKVVEVKNKKELKTARPPAKGFNRK